MKWHDRTRLKVTLQGVGAWRDVTWQSVMWQDRKWHDMTWHDTIWRGVRCYDIQECHGYLNQGQWNPCSEIEYLAREIKLIRGQSWRIIFRINLTDALTVKMHHSEPFSRRQIKRVQAYKHCLRSVDFAVKMITQSKCFATMQCILR